MFRVKERILCVFWSCDSRIMGRFPIPAASANVNATALILSPWLRFYVLVASPPFPPPASVVPLPVRRFAYLQSRQPCDHWLLSCNATRSFPPSRLPPLSRLPLVERESNANKFNTVCVCVRVRKHSCTAHCYYLITSTAFFTTISLPFSINLRTKWREKAKAAVRLCLCVCAADAQQI